MAAPLGRLVIATLLAVNGAAPRGDDLRESSASLQPTSATATSRSTGAFALGRTPMRARVSSTLLPLDSSVGTEAMSRATCLTSSSDVYNEACQLEFDLSKQQELESALGMCSWEPVDLETDSAFVKHGPPGFTSSQSPAPPEWNRVERCRRGDFETGAASASTAGALELHRIGPYVTQGGKDWTSVNTVTQAEQALNGKTFAAVDLGPVAKSFLGESWKWPATTDTRILGVREYFLGAYDGVSSLLGYPPIHQHHFHVVHEQHTIPGEMIVHGDDQCVRSEGGVNCEIRRMPAGYAIPMHLPLTVDVDHQDVRAAASANFTWYTLITIRGFPRQRSSSPFRTLTQVRVAILPAVYEQGDFRASYIVPADHISAFWREGVFNFTAPLVYSYFHTHPPWVEEMRLYVGASAAQIGMETVGIRGANLTRYARDAMDASLSRLSDHAKQAGVQMPCHFRRSAKLLEVVNHTAEVANHFYRKAASCTAFSITTGAPFVAVVVLSPDSPEAATAHASEKLPDAFLAAVHTFVRLFVHLDDVDYPTCDNHDDNMCFSWSA